METFGIPLLKLKDFRGLKVLNCEGSVGSWPLFSVEMERSGVGILVKAPWRFPSGVTEELGQPELTF